jgi:hypothetical protein
MANHAGGVAAFSRVRRKNAAKIRNEPQRARRAQRSKRFSHLHLHVICLANHASVAFSPGVPGGSKQIPCPYFVIRWQLGLINIFNQQTGTFGQSVFIFGYRCQNVGREYVPMNDPILDEQIEYYRARAQEYDASIVVFNQ